jgi:hypothetical protein
VSAATLAAMVGIANHDPYGSWDPTTTDKIGFAGFLVVALMAVVLPIQMLILRLAPIERAVKRRAMGLTAGLEACTIVLMIMLVGSAGST